MRPEYVFLDNGGVITDNSRRGSQYRRLVGEFFVPRFGGTLEAWAAANMVSFPGVWPRFLQRVEEWHASRDIIHEMSLYFADWLRSMFAAMGLQAPASDEACAALGQEADSWINPQIDARFPGAEDAIKTLAQNYRLFTASDGFSVPLAVAIGESAGRFERLYGPDLINVPKSSGRPYYDTVFAHAGVDPARALVVDDNLSNILAAQATGARTVFVSRQPGAAYEGPTIALLAELPSIIETL
jgi:FMN phosphatase YigB (HAD superfamily)